MLSNLVLVRFNCGTFICTGMTHTKPTIRQEVLPKHLYRHNTHKLDNKTGSTFHTLVQATHTNLTIRQEVLPKHLYRHDAHKPDNKTGSTSRTFVLSSFE